MSVYRLEMDFAFNTEADMQAFINLLDKMVDKVTEKKTGEFPIPRKIRYHACNHDSGEPCGAYVNVELDGTEKFAGVKPEDVVPTEVATTIKAALQKQKDDLVTANDTLTAEKATLETQKATLITEKAALAAENAELKKPATP